jgi:cbb3-type cytochrome oxidase subunit 3
VSLTDLMSHSGLSVYAVVALVLFFIAFAAIVWWVFRPANRSRWVKDAKMPLDDDHPQTPRKGKD